MNEKVIKHKAICDELNQLYRFDEGKGYHSCSYLARIARTSDQLSDAENEQEIERAIDDIIKYNPLGIYKKVKSSSDSG